MTTPLGSGMRLCRNALTRIFILNFILSTSAFLCPTRPRSPPVPLPVCFTRGDSTHKISEHPIQKTDTNNKRKLKLTNQWKRYALPTVEFIDPETQCQVILLGCVHGTESSSKDVERAVTSDTDIVALELCASRFMDLKQALLKKEQQQGQAGKQTHDKPWIVAYWEMIFKTVSQRGLPTGIAAAVLGGFSGLQTALSGFTPGLEFTTALEQAQRYNCDIILADQDVDETLRRVGSLPKIALETALSPARIDQWRLHQDTLLCAILGQEQLIEETNKKIPQVQIPAVSIRNSQAVQDLFRLTVPPTLFFWAMVLGVAATTGIDVSSNVATDTYYDTATLVEKILHWLASGGILAAGYIGLALPAVSVILTERDEILTNGIQAACRRAGKGGQVVAVLGLLHVNGVARRMLSVKNHVETPGKDR